MAYNPLLDPVIGRAVYKSLVSEGVKVIEAQMEISAPLTAGYARNGRTTQQAYMYSPEEGERFGEKWWVQVALISDQWFLIKCHSRH